MTEWEKVEGSPTSNEILQGEGFFVSYTPATLAGGFASDRGGDETAIVSEGAYFILNGDHRRAYSKLVSKGLAICMAYFEGHQDQVSSWSD